MTVIANSEGGHGFTLLEVMIALAIVATAVTALLGLANRSLAVHERLERTTRAVLLAQTRLAEVELAAASAPEREDKNGTFPPPDDLYRWRIVWLDTPLPAVRRLDLTVSWGDERRNEAVTLTSFARDRGRL